METDEEAGDADGVASDSSSASAVFRDASSSTGKPSRKRLVEFAERHPGRLAARFLNRLAAKVMVEGEAAERRSQELPVCAKAYHLRVTTTRFPDGNRRNLVEANFIAHVLDHLAARRYGQAADILAQRYTGIEANLGGLSWEKAKFLELVGEEDTSLIGQPELALVANETAIGIKVGSLAPAAHGSGWKGMDRGQASQNGWWSSKGKGKANPFGDQAADPGAQVPPAQAALPDAGWTNKGKKGKGKGKGKGKW